MATYANGQIPATALVPITGPAGARLLAGPAASWERVIAECQRRFGWTPRPTSAGDAYRDLANQVATFLDRYVPAKTGGGFYGDVRWWNGVRYVRKQGKAAAAVPGTSNHGKGRAVDVTGLGGFTGGRYAQFASVAIPLGWSNAEGRSVNEPWHWVDLLSPELVSSGHATVPGINVPGSLPILTAPNPLEEIDMATIADIISRLDNIAMYLYDGGGAVPTSPGGVGSVLQRVSDVQAALERRLTNLDRQVTGADSTAPSVAGRVIELQADVAALTAALALVPASVWATAVERYGPDGQTIVRVSALQELADTKTAVTGAAAAAPVDVDEAALAAQLAPALIAAVRTLSDEDVARIAAASADERDRRERDRLSA